MFVNVKYIIFVLAIFDCQIKTSFSGTERYLINPGFLRVLWTKGQRLKYSQTCVHYHPRDPKKAAAVDGWSLFGDHSCNKSSKWDLK